MKKIVTILTAIILFLLPWQTRLIILPGVLNGGYSEYGTVSLYATEILLWLLVILLIADFFISKKIFLPDGRRGRIKTLLIFGALYLYSLFFHQNLVTLNYLRIFIEGFLLFLIIRTVRDKTKLYWAFVFGAVLQAFLGIYQFFSQYAFGSKWLGMAPHDPAVLGTYVIEAGFGRWLRAYGALPHPNILAGYLVVAILILIKLSLDREPAKINAVGSRLEVVALPVMFMGLFFTFSRGAWIALIIGLFILIAPKFRMIKFKSLIIGLWTSAVIIFCFSILFWPLVSARTLADSRLEIKSTSERMSYYVEAWTLIKKHPVLGVGLGNYTRAVHDEIDPSRPAYNYQPVHNIFVLALAELGAIGILIIAAALYLLRKSIQWKYVLYLLPFAVIGIFDHYLWTLYPGIILFAAYCGLTLDKNHFLT